MSQFLKLHSTSSLCSTNPFVRSSSSLQHPVHDISFPITSPPSWTWTPLFHKLFHFVTPFVTCFAFISLVPSSHQFLHYTSPFLHDSSPFFWSNFNVNRRRGMRGSPRHPERSRWMTYPPPPRIRGHHPRRHRQTALGQRLAQSPPPPRPLFMLRLTPPYPMRTLRGEIYCGNSTAAYQGSFWLTRACNVRTVTLGPRAGLSQSRYGSWWRGSTSSPSSIEIALLTRLGVFPESLVWLVGSVSFFFFLLWRRNFHRWAAFPSQFILVTLYGV